MVGRAGLGVPEADLADRGDEAASGVQAAVPEVREVMAEALAAAPGGKAARVDLAAGLADAGEAVDLVEEPEAAEATVDLEAERADRAVSPDFRAVPVDLDRVDREGRDLVRADPVVKADLADAE